MGIFTQKPQILPKNALSDVHKKKKRRYSHLSFLTYFPEKLQGNSPARANVCTSSALRAYVRINRITFAFRNCSHRAFVFACTASDTIFANFVSHNCYFYLLDICPYNKFRCKSTTFFAYVQIYLYIFSQTTILFAYVPKKQYFCAVI